MRRKTTLKLNNNLLRFREIDRAPETDYVLLIDIGFFARFDITNGTNTTLEFGAHICRFNIFSFPFFGRLCAIKNSGFILGPEAKVVLVIQDK